MRPISFTARRQHFMSQLTKNHENAVAIIPAHPELIRNNDVNFKFRQDSNFFYLTGFDEPDAIAVFRNIKGKKEFVLFVRPRNFEKEIWTGYLQGVEGAVSKIGADRAYPLDDFEKKIFELLSGADCVFYSFHKTLNKHEGEYLDNKIIRLFELHRQSLGRTGRSQMPILDTHEILGEMRLFKSPEELDRIRYATQVSGKAHCEAMARVRPGLYEYQLEALLEFIFQNAGCRRHGYPSIVGSGPNATILHHVENNRKIVESDLVLIDAGAEYDYYSADITRTFPVQGKMTVSQKEIYDIVLQVQKECIRLVKPGVTFASIHQFAIKSLTQAMVTLGFLAGSIEQLIETLAYKKYYPHGTGHYLGLDVHDAGLYQVKGEPRKLEPGMIVTIEPGFYVLANDPSAPQKYLSLGVRIEDDVLVTLDGNEVLTTQAPKEIAELEALVGSKPWLDLS